MPRVKPDVAFSAFIIIIALLAPIGIAYAADYMRNATALSPAVSLADNLWRAEMVYYNGTQNKVVSVDYVIEDDDILCPSLPEPSDYQSTVNVHFDSNGTTLPASKLWELDVNKLILYVEANNLIDEVNIEIWLYASDSSSDKVHEATIKPNSTSFTYELSYSTILLAKHASYDSYIRITLGMDDIGPGDYLVVRAIWYTSQKLFNTDILDWLLAGAGICFFIAAIFATKELSLAQVLGRGRRR